MTPDQALENPRLFRLSASRVIRGMLQELSNNDLLIVVADVSSWILSNILTDDAGTRLRLTVEEITLTELYTELSRRRASL